MKRCKKHFWLKREIKFPFACDLSPGAINAIFRDMKIEICWNCLKVRNIKKENK